MKYCTRRNPRCEATPSAFICVPKLCLRPYLPQICAPIPATMVPQYRKPAGNRTRHGLAVDSHPPSTSSALGARESVRVRGLGAFPANTEVARTIASLRGMCGIDPPGRAIAVGSPNTGGVFGVWGFSCVHAASSFWNSTVGLSCLPCVSRAFVLCGSLCCNPR
jgi:hypothetical protein